MRTIFHIKSDNLETFILSYAKNIQIIQEVVSTK